MPLVDAAHPLPLPLPQDVDDAPATSAATAPSEPDRADSPRPETLESACAAIMDAAKSLRFSAGRLAWVLSTFGGLPGDVTDPNKPLSNEPAREYLQVTGARQLHQLARLLGRAEIPVTLRRAHLVEVTSALGRCLTGVVDELELALTTLRGAHGGLVAASARALAELRRDTLEGVVVRTIGRDPKHGRCLNAFFPHYLSGLEKRLALPHALRRPRDLHFDAEMFSDDQVEQARRALSQSLTPLLLARRMAEEELVLLRRRLRAVNVDPQAVDIEDERQYAALREALDGLARTVGVVPREHVIETAPRVGADEAAADRYRVVEDASLLTLAMLRALADADAPEVSTQQPARIVAWRDDHRSSEVLSLEDGLLWVRETGADERERRLRFEDLARLPLRVGPQASSGDPSARPLTTSQRAAAVRAVLGDATEEQLVALDPAWWVEAAAVRDCCRRLSRDLRASWWATIAPQATSMETRIALSVVADESGQWAALMDLTCVEAPLDAELWSGCDGALALAQALRADDARRLTCWGVLLERAAPAMSQATLLRDLSCKSENGTSALVDAIRMGRTTSLQAWLDLVAGLHGVALKPATTLPLLIGFCGVARPAIAEALTEDRSESLAIYLRHLWTRLDAGTLSSSDVQKLLAASLGVGEKPDLEPKLLVAMHANRGAVVGVWLDGLLEAARRGVITPPALVRLMTARGTGDRGAYEVSIVAQADETRRGFLAAVERARDEGLLHREQAITLLLGEPGCSHPPALAAKRGLMQVIEEHLSSENRLLRARRGEPVDPLESVRWWRGGAHTTIDAAMGAGQSAMVKRLVDAALRPELALSNADLLRAFQRRQDQHKLALRSGVEGGHEQAVAAWFAGVAEAAEQRRLGRLDVRGLLRAADGAGNSVLHLAADQHYPTAMAARLAREMVAVSARTGLSSRDLLSLLGPRHRGDQDTPLMRAVMKGRVADVGGLMDAMLGAWSQGRLQIEHLRRLLSMQARDKATGLASVITAVSAAEIAAAEIDRPDEADGPDGPDEPDEAVEAIGAYVAGLLRALRQGAIRVESAAAWLSTGRPDTDQAMRPLILRVVLAQERRGAMAADQLAALRAALPTLPALTAAP